MADAEQRGVLACAFTCSLTIRALISVKEGGPWLSSSPSSSLA